MAPRLAVEERRPRTSNLSIALQQPLVIFLRIQNFIDAGSTQLVRAFDGSPWASRYSSRGNRLQRASVPEQDYK